MTEQQAEEAAAKVVAKAADEKLTVQQARAYAASLGLEITPAMTDGDRYFRAFVYVTPEGTRRKLATRIADLREG